MKNGKKPKTSYRCGKCKDTGWIIKFREDGTSYAVSCKCREREKVRLQWKAAGMNIDSLDMTFSNFRVWNKFSEILKSTSIAYFNDFFKIKSLRKNSLLLCGQPGGGKTHIAVAVAINLISSGVNVMYMPYRETFRNIKLNIKDENFYKRTLEKFERCDLLLIDDLYKGKVSLAEINIMFEVINYRYVNHLPILVSSERTIEEILSIDEGIGSRIYEMCRGYMVTIPKEECNNFRLRKEEDFSG